MEDRRSRINAVRLREVVRPGNHLRDAQMHTRPTHRRFPLVIGQTRALSAGSGPVALLFPALIAIVMSISTTGGSVNEVLAPG